jgi:hypothetical protein
MARLGHRSASVRIDVALTRIVVRESMTAAGPVRDSVLDALGYAIRVLTKPGYWWAPALLTTISVLPLLALPGMPGMPGSPGFGARSAFATPAEMEAYFRTFIPVIIASVLLAIVIAPISAATAYRLALQYTNGEPPRPFGPGFIDLAWRFFLQIVALLLLILGSAFGLVVAFAMLQAVIGFGLAALLAMIAWIVATVAFVARLAIAPALLVGGAGPVESITWAWRMTEGQAVRVLRWVLVTGIIAGIAASAISGLISVVLGAVGQYLLGSVAAAAITGPFSVVGAVVIILLARLLSGPVEPPPTPELPPWMNASGTPEPPATG